MKLQGIERKFLLNKLPLECSETNFVNFERYYLYIDKSIELRIQQKNDTYELERKVQDKENKLARVSHKLAISKAEFEILKDKSIGKKIVFKKYKLTNSDIAIKKYENEFEGLILLEVEFKTLEDALSFQAQKWMGKDVSDSPFSRDSALIHTDSFQEINFDLET